MKFLFAPFYIRVISLMVILLTYVTNVASQNTVRISGQILDEKDKPIAYATIGVKSTGTGVVCDENGKFSFALPLQKSICLVIRSVGYKQKLIDINLNSKEAVRLVEHLSANSEYIKEVTVNVAGKGRRIQQQGFNVEVIDTKSLEYKSVDVNTLLKNTPGITVRQDGGLGSKTSYSINGLSGKGVRFFIDGVPMEYMGSSYSVSSIPVNLIERIEVYKGVVPVELSTDALGGVINIVTKKVRNSSLSLSYSAGSFNTHKASLIASLKRKNGFVTNLSSFYNYSDNNYKIWGDHVIIVDDDPDSPTYGKGESGMTVKRFHDAYESYGTKIEVGFLSKKWADNFLIGVNLSKMDKEVQDGATMQTPYGERLAGQQTAMASLNYSKRDLFSKGLGVSVSAFYSKNHRNVVDTTTNTYNWYGNKMYEPYPSAGESGTATLAINDQYVLSGTSKLNYKLSKKQRLGVNVMYTHDKTDSDDELKDAIDRMYGDSREIIKYTSGANYLYKSLNNKFTSTVFGKYFVQKVIVDKMSSETDHGETTWTPYQLNTKKDYWGYGFTSNVTVFNWMQISISGEKALRLPSSKELFGDATEITAASFTLKPESSNNINLGFNFPALLKDPHDLRLNFNLFYRDTKDKIKQSLTASDDEYQYINFEKILSKGIDLSAIYCYKKKLTVSINGSYLDSRYMQKYSETGNINAHYKNREPNTPFLTGNSSVEHVFDQLFVPGDIFRISGNFQYVHWYYRDWEIYGNQGKVTIPSQNIFSTSLAYTFQSKKLTWSFEFNNITNEQAFDNYAKQLPGRAFYTKITFHI